ncbi:glycoside hydrolase family 43 protein [Parasphingorhabdus pacifica]
MVMVVPFLVAAALGTGPRAGQGEASSGPAGSGGTNATFYNDAANPAADPHVLYDESSGYYYAYSTEGADPEHVFAIYRSPDLATWERLPGGAMERGDGNHWGHDWFWAPEVYHNTETGLYFLFYSARMREGVAEHFRYPDFEEASKIGVAVADSPGGPFRNITDQPIDYFPYDPDYHDVNLIMDATQKKPPGTLAEGRTAPLGTYIPSIDPNVFFDDGRMFLYFSRNAYRNWVWDRDLGKYVEESNILAVELDDEWWHDPTGRTMPKIHSSYRDANRDPEDPPGVRKDGFTQILDYGSDQQAWENAHVDDYAETGGKKKDRRWAEGSTVVKAFRADGRPLYFLTYSANNFADPFYGVGYAVAESPLGPWRKSPDNPVLAQDEQRSMYSTGHGSVTASPDGSQLYYVHHGRPSVTTNRRLYTERMRIDADAATLRIDQSTSDEPVPAGVAPYELAADRELVDLAGGRGRVNWEVRSASGAALDLVNPSNRVTAELAPVGAVRVEVEHDHAVLVGEQSGVSALNLRYQRRRSDGTHVDVSNIDDRWHPVGKTVPVAACTSKLTERNLRSLDVSEGVLCLRGGTVSGDVRVAPGASLVVLGTRIGGSVHARDGEALWLSDSDIAGSVDGRSVVGGVRIDGIRAGGSVTLVGNRGSRPPVVAGSDIAGSLLCVGNAPDPTNLGRSNTIRGTVRGQCSEM